METKYLNILQTLKNNSYSPYSNFAVAALVVINDDTIIKGVNVENIAFGDTICAEKTALTQTYTLGFKKQDIKAIHIYSKNGVTPCGSCRQVMRELLWEQCPIYIYDAKQLIQIYKNNDLLPTSFNSIK